MNKKNKTIVFSVAMLFCTSWLFAQRTHAGHIKGWEEKMLLTHSTPFSYNQDTEVEWELKNDEVIWKQGVNTPKFLPDRETTSVNHLTIEFTGIKKEIQRYHLTQIIL